MKSRTSISKIKEGSNHSTGRFVITRNKIQVKRNSKRRLVLEENKLQYELRTLIAEENKENKIGLYRVALTAKLATILCQAQKAKAAEKLLRVLLLECSNKLEENHYFTISTAINLSSVLRKQEKFMQAKGLCAWTLRVNMKLYGKFHTRTLVSVSAMAQIFRQYSIMNHNLFLKEEEKLWRWALQGAHINYGMNHPSTLAAVANLSDFCWRYGKTNESETLLRNSLSSLPDESPLRYHAIVLHLVRELIDLLHNKKSHREQHNNAVSTTNTLIDVRSGMNNNNNNQTDDEKRKEDPMFVDEAELENLKRWEMQRSGIERVRLEKILEKYELEQAIQYEKYYGDKKDDQKK